ncbi:CinA family nicotinamide mononucleotide deamidase-related protein [Flavihumibacter profundi]|uniref:CinA family nicotinamide mononucleotide deamidase-related protein n=1 Tax=Flavihumibacter profundi TaxID=2716883 RepID=UPI001CC5A4CF|nr:CinA family nicotinamide mononucleotide deamidase-related protein [Flavihumibacter profundi]MBZ5855723.1 CinA family nicotinamide mononucleotide deamidase-related protein [Flavihumibacter profundi]
MQKFSASIITIGDELLIGQVIDTNSAWMAQQLNRIGITVNRRIAVGDEWEAIWKALDQEIPAANIVLITGGLGPTADDITKPLLCDYFGGKMVQNEQVLQHVHYLFEKVYGRPMIERNANQAMVPDVCTVLHNANGTAPGMWFEKDNTIVVSLPGVPFEMKGLMLDEVIPALQKKFELPQIYHRTLLTAGIGESFLAERIAEYENALPKSIKLAYLPSYGMVRLRLSTIDLEAKGGAKEIDWQFLKLQSLLTDVIVTNKDEPLEAVVANLLLEQQKTIGTAESCTGGYIAQLFTAMPGSSRYFKGGVISYANEVKHDILQVAEETLETAGAVSEDTVIQMVKGALAALKTDFALATSGIMGPDGGTPEKPVGTVWVAVGNQDEIITQKFKFRFDRRRNIDLTALNAMNLCRKFILDQTQSTKS